MWAGGPAALFVLKRILEQKDSDVSVTIFEAKDTLGQGMPYSPHGAEKEHVTNISSIEVPEIKDSLTDWLKAIPDETLREFNIDRDGISKYKVVPRLLFGKYLNFEFCRLLDAAVEKGKEVIVAYNSVVTDVKDLPESSAVVITVNGTTPHVFNTVVLCNGHIWPKTYEEKVEGYFDSPYPPKKLRGVRNHAVALRGSSLTAIDAIKTLARANGTFKSNGDGQLEFVASENSRDFKIVMHSREGFLPAVRFHLDDPQLSLRSLLTKEEIEKHRNQNGGFVSLDYLFEKDFKEQFKEKEPDFYRLIGPMDLELFVETMMKERELSDPFDYFKKEYDEARESIRAKESIYWKEKLTILSLALNFPTKYFSAEDKLRLQSTLMPLISLVIASVPQGSCEELFAMRSAGRLELVAVGQESSVTAHPVRGAVFKYQGDKSEREPAHFETFVDCIGQPHLPFEQFPFRSLVNDGTIAPATLRFRSAEAGKKCLNAKTKNVESHDGKTFKLRVPGIAINDSYQALNNDGVENDRIYVMAVPLIGGLNPDYSGLDFCESASKQVVKGIFGSKSSSATF